MKISFAKLFVVMVVLLLSLLSFFSLVNAEEAPVVQVDFRVIDRDDGKCEFILESNESFRLLFMFRVSFVPEDANAHRITESTLPRNVDLIAGEKVRVPFNYDIPRGKGRLEFEWVTSSPSVKTVIENKYIQVRESQSFSLFSYEDLDGYPNARVIDGIVRLSFRIDNSNDLDQVVSIYRTRNTWTHSAREWFWGGSSALTKALQEENDQGSVEGWEKFDYDASDWNTIQVPASWRDVGLFEFNGVLWHRKEFTLSQEWLGKDLLLSLGPICDEDITWFNGNLIGNNDNFRAVRTYTVPKEIVKEGKNVIAVRVTDTSNLGGIWGQPNQVYIETVEDDASKRMSLAGQWLCKVGLDLYYYQKMAYNEHERIYQTSVSRFRNDVFEFIDYSVEVGNTYVYWIVLEGREEMPIGPVAVRVWDSEVVYTNNEINARMDVLVRFFPDYVKQQSYGRTAKGTSINGLVIGNSENLVALIGAVHASEAGPELILYMAEQLLINNRELLDEIGLAILPSANPDERDRMAYGAPWFLRTNANGVDINRNFPIEWEQVSTKYNMNNTIPGSTTYRGPEPVSEPETHAIMNFIRDSNPRVVISMHGLYSLTGSNFYGPPFAGMDWAYIRECQRLAAAYTEGMYPEQSLPVKSVTAGTGGSLPAWVYEEFRVPVFDLELGSDNTNTRRTQVWEIASRGRTTASIVKEYQERHYMGVLAMMNAVIKDE